MKEHSQKNTVSINIKQFNRQCAQQRAKTNNPSNKYQKRVHNYLIDTTCILGQGTFSIVYKGKDLLRAKDVAIKVIEISRIQQTGIEKLFKEELSIIQRLNHPNIVACLQYFRTANNCYTVYQFCEEGDLARLLQKGHLGQKEDLHQANSYIKDVFQGLLYLQSVNIVHRDIKAANIFLDQGKARIGDFGFATRCNSQFRDASIGSPAYMAPEGLIHNYYGPKTDVWAFGMLIYQMLHGSTPFYQCSSQAELKSRIRIPINWDQLKANLPSSLKRLILKCLKVDSKQRPSFNQLLNDEYIRKLYSQTPIKRLNTKSIYSRHTSDTQKLFESTSISSMLEAIKKRDSLQTAGYKSQQSQESARQIAKLSKKDISLPVNTERLYTEQDQQVDQTSNLTQNQCIISKEEQNKQEKEGNLFNIQEKKIQLIDQQHVSLLHNLGQAYNYQNIIQNIDIFIQTITLEREIRLNFAQPLSFYLLIQKLLKEIYCLYSLKQQTKALQQVSLQYQRFHKVIKGCTLPQNSQISYKQSSKQVFGLIKEVQIMIDKQDITQNIQNLVQIDSKNLILYGNYLILSYKHLQNLESKTPARLETSKQKLQSSEQFYIWLYQIELQKMDEM